MQQKVYKLILLATLFFVGLYSFNTTVVAAEEEDFNKQEITFTLIQGKDIPNNSGQQGTGVTKPLGRLFPSTGEVQRYLYPIIGSLLFVLFILCLVIKRYRKDETYENK